MNHTKSKKALRKHQENKSDVHAHANNHCAANTAQQNRYCSLHCQKRLAAK